MNTVYFDSSDDDALRREKLYEGQIYVLAPRPSTIALIEHARDMIETAFGGIDPQLAQYEMPVEKYVEICAPLKPAFIHNDTTKELLRNVVDGLRLRPRRRPTSTSRACAWSPATAT